MPISVLEKLVLSIFESVSILNPSIDIFNVEFNIHELSEIFIEVKNILGTTVHSHSSEKLIGNFTRKIDLTSFSKGTYLLQIKIGADFYFRKLILN